MAHKQGGTQRHARRRVPVSSSAPSAAMDPEARRRACVEFRAKLSRDTGVTFTAAICAGLLDETFQGDGGEEVTLQSDPGLFYISLGAAIEAKTLPLVLPNRLKVATSCYRQAAEVHPNPAGMGKLAKCLYHGQGVTKDRAQAAVWFQKAADLGDGPSKVTLGSMLVVGNALAGVAKNAARGIVLLSEAVDQGCGAALYLVADCYLKGEGVEKDAAHGVSLLRQVINQEDCMKAKAEIALTICYMEGNGVEADTVQAALWCQQAATSGDASAGELLAVIRRCDFCGTTPARQLCARCRKVRYSNHQCQLAHWNRESDSHKEPCKEHRRRAAAEASHQLVGGASTSAHQ